MLARLLLLCFLLALVSEFCSAALNNVTSSGITTTKSDVSTTKSDVSTTSSGATTTKSDVSTTSSGATTTKSDVSTSSSGSTTSKPSTTQKGDTTTTQKSDTTTTQKSDTTTTKGSGTTTTRGSGTTTTRGSGTTTTTRGDGTTTTRSEKSTTSNPSSTNSEDNEDIETSSYETTSSETIYESDTTCEKNDEPQNSCSLLLEVTVKTQSLITLRQTLYTIFKESWSVIADISQYTTISVDLYVESLTYSDLSSSSRKLLQTVSTSTPITETTEGPSTVVSTSASASQSTIVVTSPQTTAATATEVATTETATEVATTAAAATTAATTDATYYYELTFGVALFDSSCSDISLWYTFFSTYSDFAVDYLDNLKSYADTYSPSTSGFGDLELVSATLYERSESGDVIQQTSFSTTSDASLQGKNIMYIGFFVLLSVFMIL